MIDFELLISGSPPCICLRAGHCTYGNVNKFWDMKVVGLSPLYSVLSLECIDWSSDCMKYRGS